MFGRGNFLLKFEQVFLSWIYFNSVYITPMVAMPFNNFLKYVNLDDQCNFKQDCMTIRHKDVNKLVPLVFCNFLLNKASFSWLYGEKCFKDITTT